MRHLEESQRKSFFNWKAIVSLYTLVLSNDYHNRGQGGSIAPDHRKSADWEEKGSRSAVLNTRFLFILAMCGCFQAFFFIFSLAVII